MAVRLLTDSASYIPQEDIDTYGIRVISMILVEGDRITPEVEIDYKEFYAHLAQVDYLPTTTQPTPEFLRSELLRILDAGDDVLGVFIPASFSGTLATLGMVADQLIAEFPELHNRIALIDSESVCMEEGFAVLAAAQCAQEGGSLADCIAAVRATQQRTRFIFAPRSLSYLERGGRIGRASALLGGLLKLVPVLTVEAAITTVYSKVRTYPKALMTIRDKFVADIEASGGLKKICVHCIAETEQAAAFCKNVIEPLVGFAVRLIPVGPVVGAHVGPAVGIVYETINPIAPLHGDSILSRLGDVRLPNIPGLRGRRDEDGES